MGDGKRHLKVLQDREDPAPPREPWQWAGIGTVAIVLAWLPLAMLATSFVKARLAAAMPQFQDPKLASEAWLKLAPGKRLELSLTIMGSQGLAMVVAAVLGGWLVGRYGAPAGPRQALASGATAAMVASVLGFQRGAGGMIEWTMMAFTVCLVAAFSAGGGALLGARMRPDDAA